MNIVLGATGQVGSRIVRELAQRNLPVRAVVRGNQKRIDHSGEIATADFFDAAQLTKALAGGTTVSFSNRKTRPHMTSWETQNRSSSIIEGPLREAE